MLSREAWAERKVLDELTEYTASESRFVDMGLLVHVVAQSADGAEPWPGAPPVRILRSHRFGGIVDTHARPVRFVGRSVSPVVAYVGEAQEALVLHDAPQDRILVHGAEGAGKTEVLRLWLILRVLEFTGLPVIVGCTAPTVPRLAMVESAIKRTLPASWFHWTERRQRFEFANGVALQMVGTHRHSEAVGEKTQGWNFAACGSDEIQDTTQTAEDGIEMRGRTAPNGRYRRLCTASVKDSSHWRNRRDARIASGLWHATKLDGPSNPFVHARFWEDKKLVLDPRAYKRRVLALDVAPEFAVYHCFDRAIHLRHVPRIGARDVTAAVIRRVTGMPNMAMLLGHDPGEICDVTVGLKAFELPELSGAFGWFAVFEHTTERTTTEQHAVSLLRRLREEYGYCMSMRGVGFDPHCPIVHMRIDPYGESDTKPDKSVHKQFAKLGFHVRSAAYRNGKGSGRVPKEARLEMMNRLLASADGVHRLFIAINNDGMPAAPGLVNCLEGLERDRNDQAEKQKGAEDKSHWGAATGYGLWPFERLTIHDNGAGYANAV